MFDLNDCEFKLQDRMLELKVGFNNNKFEFWRGWILIGSKIKNRGSITVNTLTWKRGASIW